MMGMRTQHLQNPQAMRWLAGGEQLYQQLDPWGASQLLNQALSAQPNQPTTRGRALMWIAACRAAQGDGPGAQAALSALDVQDGLDARQQLDWRLFKGVGAFHVMVNQLCLPGLRPGNSTSRVALYRASSQAAWHLLGAAQPSAHQQALWSDLQVPWIRYFLSALHGQTQSEASLLRMAMDSRRGQDPAQTAEVLFLFGLTCLAHQRHDLATSAFVQAERGAAATGWRRLQTCLLFEMSALEESRGNHREALAHLKACHSLAMGQPPTAQVAPALETPPNPLINQTAPTTPALEPAVPTRAVLRVRQAEAYILPRLAQKIPVEQVAAHCGVSSRTLESDFQAVKGHTVVEHVTRLKMDQARLRLVQESCRISELATQFGYASTLGFAKAFERCHGLSPTAFKRQLTRTS